MPDIVCDNPWMDYTGGPDHHSIEEARKCEREDGRTHSVIVPLDDYERLIISDEKSLLSMEEIDEIARNTMAGFVRKKEQQLLEQMRSPE